MSTQDFTRKGAETLPAAEVPPENRDSDGRVALVKAWARDWAEEQWADAVLPIVGLNRSKSLPSDQRVDLEADMSCPGAPLANGPDAALLDAAWETAQATWEEHRKAAALEGASTEPDWLEEVDGDGLLSARLRKRVWQLAADCVRSPMEDGNPPKPRMQGDARDGDEAAILEHLEIPPSRRHTRAAKLILARARKDYEILYGRLVQAAALRVFAEPVGEHRWRLSGVLADDQLVAVALALAPEAMAALATEGSEE